MKIQTIENSPTNKQLILFWVGALQIQKNGEGFLKW